VGGRFITFEGVEGSGKSTQLARLAADLRGGGELEVVTTREPGVGLGPDLRDLMLFRARYTPWTMACLMSADRAEHVLHTLRPALARGAWVLCDRYTDSTLAYQGGGLGVDRAALQTLNAQATDGLVPDLTLVFDLPLETSLARAHARGLGRPLDRFESEERAFHERVRAVYLALAEAEPARVKVVSADADEDTVFARVKAALAPLLARHA
jgi:dTMP kinase